MTLSPDVLLFVCFCYVALLFAVAFFVDKRARYGRLAWLRSPVVYTLSISVYCTSWTFYGAVGSAARNGLEFITIYLGPTLVFVGWWWLLRKLVRIGREHRITSIADLISSRYGKSSSLAILVTLIAVIAITPYIALQLQSVTRSYQVVAGEADALTTSFWVAAGMALFTILFGTRNLDANERHHGVVAAIAVEAVVKLVALIAVGVFVVFGLGGGLDGIFADLPEDFLSGGGDIFGPRWIALTFLSATAVICLPRQFQVTVVENIDERHLSTASWLFPLYLFGMTLFIVPIAVAGMKFLPPGSNPDLFVLTLPLAEDRQDIALLAFLGGFSSATSMVIVAAIAVSTMVSNHIVMPLALRLQSVGRDMAINVRGLLLTSRRISIALILGLGFVYFQLSGGSDALASIGLLAFMGVAQFLPSLLGGIFWRGATRIGAIAGLATGFVLWVYTLLLPSLGGDVLIGATVMSEGPWGIGLLRPQALLGLAGMDPLVHALVWSLGANALVFMVVSALSEARPLERVQGALFIGVFRGSASEPQGLSANGSNSEDLFILVQRILGAEPARRLFDDLAQSQGRPRGLPLMTDAVVARLERELAGSVGAASAHAMVSGIVGRQSTSITELMDIADETQQLIETSRQLSQKSGELEKTARQLRQANDRLRTLDTEKDSFLTQVSHELRTPMTSIRSFSEILLGEEGVEDVQRRRFLAIIHDESLRLTRLLDEILDISRLEQGTLTVPLAAVDAGRVIAASVDTVAGIARTGGVTIRVHDDKESVLVTANADRLRQVLINLLTNAVKYNDDPAPTISVTRRTAGAYMIIEVADNGGGVSREEATAVFQNFTRGRRSERDNGAGLGLPISRAIMRAMEGELTLEFLADGSSYFRLRLRRHPVAAGGNAAVPTEAVPAE